MLMAWNSTVKKTFEELPEDKQSEVIDFIMFLSRGHKKAEQKQKVKPFPFDGLKGKPYYVSDDFDDTLDDFGEYM